MPGIDSNTKLMLSLDGTDGDTSTTDESDSNHTINFNATAHLEDTEKKWGTTSLQLDGDSDYLDIDDSADWDVFASNSDDWIIDFWVKHTDHANTERYIVQREDNANFWSVLHVSGSGLLFYVQSVGASLINTGYGGEIIDTNWHHIAACKVGSEYAIYKDGTQVNYVDVADVDTFAGSLYIGYHPDFGQYFDGYLEEIRIQHSNYFGAAPNDTPDDTITVPPSSYARDLEIDVHDCTDLVDKVIGG